MNEERLQRIKDNATAEIDNSYPYNIFAEYCLDLIEYIEQLKNKLEENIK